MKKMIISIILAVSAFSVPVYAEEQELPHVESDAGIYDLTGYEFYEYNGKNFLILFNRYENTTSENAFATVKYTNKVFQDGVQCEVGICDYGYMTEKGKSYKSATTELQPGGVLEYLTTYEIAGQSDIEYNVQQFLGSETLASYTIPFGGEASIEPESEPDYKTMYEELLKEYEQLQADYEALKAE